MQSLVPHPATCQLVRYQAAAQFNSFLSSFRNKRRLVLSLLAVALGVLWIGQAIAGLLLREPADAQKLASWIPLGLLCYSLWHVTRITCRSPVEPFEWTPAERELLRGAPLRRAQLVAYRLMGILTAAVIKAGCFCLVMLPDLTFVPASFAGMLLALLFVDMIRMAAEIACFGLSRHALLWLRSVVLSFLGGCLLLVLTQTVTLFRTSASTGDMTLFGILQHFGQFSIQLRDTWFGKLLEWPFQPFSRLILAGELATSTIVAASGSALLVVSMMRVVVWLDEYWHECRLLRERQHFGTLQALTRAEQIQRQRRPGKLKVPPRWRGAGTLFWRQLRGAWHYRMSLFTALLVPGVLTCLTLVVPQTRFSMLSQLVGGLVFYTFVLLPTALKFDFRRDIDRMAVLKSLPVSPTAVTLGQLSVPVLLSTLFQVAVLGVAFAVRPFHPGWGLLAIFLLLPINVLIFALENVIYLLYPYRLNQEGIMIFLRSILTFTGKGLLFAVGLVVTILWGMLARQLGWTLFEGRWIETSAIFVTGMWMLASTTATGLILVLIRCYCRFDPSQDLPAAS